MSSFFLPYGQANIWAIGGGECCSKAPLGGGGDSADAADADDADDDNDNVGADPS